MDLINLWWLCFGALVAWLIQWVWDWVWFRSRRRAVSEQVETQLSTLGAERDSLAVDLRACGDRRVALEGEVANLRAQAGGSDGLRMRIAELEPLAGRVELLTAENARLQAELEAARSVSPAEATLGGSGERGLVLSVGGAEGEELSSLRAYNLAMYDELGATRRALARFAAGKGDPLIDIDGIGPVYQKKLYEQGVVTFEQLAAMHPEYLRGLVAPNAVFELDTTTWIEQARRLAGRPVRDPLIDINGVGPVYEQRLLSAGVISFEQLSQMSPEEIRAIVRPEAWQNVQVEDWIAEARELAAQVRAGTYLKGEY